MSFNKRKPPKLSKEDSERFLKKALENQEKRRKLVEKLEALKKLKD